MLPGEVIPRPRHSLLVFQRVSRNGHGHANAL
jgi:hypothetical protein